MSETYQRLAHPVGTVSIMWCLCPSGGARCCLARHGASWENFHALRHAEGGQIIEGHLLPTMCTLCIAIPPKYPVPQ